MNWTRSFLDNHSVFGRLMTRCGILIAGNLLFLAFSLPVITIGASWTALCYTMLKTLRSGEVNPFAAFWKGFRENLVQATAAFLLLSLLTVFLMLELFWCGQFEGPVALFRYGILALLLAEIVTAAYLFPTMAAFRGTLRELLRDSVYFAVGHPLRLVLVLLAHTVPAALTYFDAQRLPLYAFLWCLIGFSGIAMFCGKLMLTSFAPLLSKAEGEETDGEEEQSQGEILRDMEKLGM